MDLNPTPGRTGFRASSGHGFIPTSRTLGSCRFHDETQAALDFLRAWQEDVEAVGWLHGQKKTAAGAS